MECKTVPFNLFLRVANDRSCPRITQTCNRLGDNMSALLESELE